MNDLQTHFIPILLTRPRILLDARRTLTTLFGAVRSAAFLSSFVSLYWFSVCVTRSIVLARLFPWISHDFWDGPLGCILVGSLMCGSSIWVENGRRRGEMALYVLPRAIRACLPEVLFRTRRRMPHLIEQSVLFLSFADIFRRSPTMILGRLVFVVSISTLVTTGIHRPNNLRGLSRWTLSFILNGPRTGFWKDSDSSTTKIPSSLMPKDLTDDIDTPPSSIP